jgi:hypothetical protein
LLPSRTRSFTVVILSAAKDPDDLQPTHAMQRFRHGP